MIPLSEIGPFPEFFSGVVVAIHARRAEADNGTFGVEGGRGVAVGIILPVAFLLFVGNVFLPEKLAIGAGEADEAAPAARLVALRQEDLVTPDHGGREAPILERDLPFDVLLVVPLMENVLLLAKTLPGRAAPGWPIGGMEAGKRHEDSE